METNQRRTDRNSPVGVAEMGFNLPNVFNSFLPDQNADDKEIERETESSDLRRNFIEGQAIVDQPIHPKQSGRVRFQGSWWYARCNHDVTLLPGEVVDVMGLQDITLIVEPAFSLKASRYGLSRIEEVFLQRNFSLSRPPLPSGLNENQSSVSQDRAIDLDPTTWKRFLQGKPVYIQIFKAYCHLLDLDWKEVVGPPPSPQASMAAHPIPTVPTTPPPPPPLSDSHLDFVGRMGAIADLQTLVREGNSIIVIQGRGGIGKTTLARNFFAQGDYERVLECWMPKQSQNLTPVESLVQEWLQRDFHEQPGRTLGVSLERLRRRLQTEKVGVFIDNLESALDREGKFIEPHQGYVELLNMLADPETKAVTLITSREPLHDGSLSVQPYKLKSLDLEAWQQFFESCQIQTNPNILRDIHQAYGGNAKAMRILSSTVRMDYRGNLDAYWHEHKSDLLAEADVGDLVASHFNRLKSLYPEAHKLLCRLGCYRHQAVPKVPLDGLIALMWDSPADQHRRIIRFLRDLFLIEVDEGGYWLHSMIQAKAIALLHASGEWEIANRKAAEFWTRSVATVETPEDALRALEAYYHYGQIQDWEQAAQVLLQPRNSRWEKEEPLGVSFHRLGLLQPMGAAITPILERIPSGYALSKLNNILGDLYWLMGDIHQAIACHQKARQEAIAHQLRNLELVSQFNIGLCQIELGEIEEALRLFQSVNALAENTDCHMYAVGSWFCLAYLHAYLGHRTEALQFARKVSSEYATLSSTAWSRGYSLLFLGRTFLNLGDTERAEKAYTMAKSYGEDSHYLQVQARALNGLAIVCRERHQFEEALSRHLAAVQILEQLAAKSDLAQVRLQLAITYQRMKQLPESEENFQTAIHLFQQMGAPKQVERVQHAMKG